VAVETFGEAVHRLRVASGMSLRELARRACVDPGHLSRIQAGRRPPTPGIAAVLDQVLAADGALLAGSASQAVGPLLCDGWGRADSDALAAGLTAETPTADNALRLAHEWLVVDPPQVYEMRAGRHIGAGTVEQIEQRVQQLRILDDHLGGIDTYELVTGELAATLDLLREAAYTEAVGGQLLVAVSELCQVAGWVTSDAGRPAEAARFYLTGVRAAHAGGDQPGAANNLSSLAYQTANIASAARGAEKAATATTRALLQERVAWAHAKAAEHSGADRALGRVDEAFAEREPADDPLWTYWLDAHEVAIMAGRCWTELRRPLRAVPVLEQALARYGPDTARETALYRTWLAEAYLQANEVEQAAATATKALELERSTHSARSTARIDYVRALLEPYRGNPDVDAFEEAYQTHAAA
jgi:transcriptional regulator with XRE-family HTH domain